MTDETINHISHNTGVLLADIPHKVQNSDYCILKETHTEYPRKLNVVRGSCFSAFQANRRMTRHSDSLVSCI